MSTAPGCRPRSYEDIDPQQFSSQRCPVVRGHRRRRRAARACRPRPPKEDAAAPKPAGKKKQDRQHPGARGSTPPSRGASCVISYPTLSVPAFTAARPCRPSSTSTMNACNITRPASRSATGLGQRSCDEAWTKVLRRGLDKGPWFVLLLMGSRT